MSEEKKKIEDGGAAFPMTDSVKNWNDGMSLRDYFAGQALIALLTNFTEGRGKGFGDLAKEAYWMADDMIAHRAK